MNEETLQLEEENRLRLADDRREQPSPPLEKNERHKNPNAVQLPEAMMMVAVAFLFDALQAALLYLAIGAVINSILGFIAGAIFWIWFRNKLPGSAGMFRFFRNPAANNMLTTFLEFIPGLNALPIRTAGTICMIIITHLPIASLSEAEQFAIQ